MRGKPDKVGTVVVSRMLGGSSEDDIPEGGEKAMVAL